MEQATGLPPAAYCDEDFFAIEQQRLFGRSWVAVAEASEVAEPRRVLVRRVGDTSILVVRGRDGVLRGFVNSCRHRGTELAASDCSVRNLIRCPYHRWSYTLEGSLVATPLFETVPRPGFDRSDYPLIPVRVATWGAHVFACANDTTPTLEHWLGDLPERLGEYGLEGWRIDQHLTFDVAANWKLLTENFQEYYHLPWVHPELARVSRVRDHYRFQGPGMYCGQTTTPVSSDERDDWVVLPPVRGLDHSDSLSGRFMAVFPNLLLSILPGHAFTIRLEPVSANRTREHCALLVPTDTSSDASEEALQETLKFWIEINSEDIDICERSQRGLSAGSIAPGPLSPRFEEPLHRFQNMVATLMTATDVTDGFGVPPGDGPEAAERFGAGANPVPAAIDQS